MLIDVTDLKTIPKKIEDIIMTDFGICRLIPYFFCMILGIVIKVILYSNTDALLYGKLFWIYQTFLFCSAICEYKCI